MFERNEELIAVRTTLYAMLKKYAVRMDMKYNDLDTVFTIHNDIDNTVEIYRVQDDFTITLSIDDCKQPEYIDTTYQNILDFKSRNLQIVYDLGKHVFAYPSYN
jgi:hypothetical protein